MQGGEREVKIEDVEANFTAILEQVGEASYVNWEGFTKCSTQLTKQMDELVRNIAIYKEIQQRRFLGTMKKLKSYDVPDLIKTVKSKKLPKEALKAIIPKFKFDGDKLVLVEGVETLKGESSKVYEEYKTLNDSLSEKLKQTSTQLQEAINSSGLYQHPPEPKELVSTFKHSFAEDKLEAAKAAIQVEYLPGTVDTLHIKTYAQIVDATLEIVKSQYKRLTTEAREKQRKIFGESKQYIDALLQYLTNTEVLIIEGQKALVGKLGMTQQKFEESENSLMQKGLAQNLLIIQSTLRTRVKESITAEKDASLEKAKEILNYQVTELKTKTDFFKQIFDKLERTPDNYQMIPMLLALTLNDMVYKKYGLEEEDFMKNVGDNVILSNPDVMNIFKQMQGAIIKLMQELGIITPEASQLMQEQARQGLQGMPPGAGGPTGLPPGANPLDLLQLQQNHQFEQMQKFLSQNPPKK